ncbi:AraD1 family protein [Ruegeria sp.]|uniref:AraD1 family protein n=1 Tax=Ruegeria sp. TaxID=1879320 RepID=UPI003C7B41C9
MRLSQILDENGAKIVCATDEAGVSRKLAGVADIRSLALAAIDAGSTIPAVIADKISDEKVDLAKALDENRILAPIDHEDPAHVFVSGSGLSHKSWYEQEKVHHGADKSQWPDHFKTLELGHSGGKPAPGEFGAQPEWFYKGNGQILIPPGGAVEHPFYGDGPGEEAEVAGIYIIGPNREAYCIGYALGNEFADEQMYFKNVYHLAQSKKRQVSLGPELLVGALPKDISARITLHRKGDVQWQADFKTGEDNMLHSLANIEAHYFKYRDAYIPGDIHVLYFGNAVMSTEQGEVMEDGDVFELECAVFGLPLVNSIKFGDAFDTPETKGLW